MTSILLSDTKIEFEGRSLSLQSTEKDVKQFCNWSRINDTPFTRAYRTEMIRVTFWKVDREILGFAVFKPAKAVMPDGTFMGERIVDAEARGWKFTDWDSSWIHPDYPTLSFVNEVEDAFDDQTGLGTVCMMFLSNDQKPPAIAKSDRTIGCAAKVGRALKLLKIWLGARGWSKR